MRLIASAGTQAIYAAVVIAALARICASLQPGWSELLLQVSVIRLGRRLFRLCRCLRAIARQGPGDELDQPQPSPISFLRWPCTALAGGGDIARLRAGAGAEPRRARRLLARRDGANHVPARSRGVADHADLGRDEPRRHRNAGLAPSARRRHGKDRSAAGRRIHVPVPRHRLALGTADAGHLLGLGWRGRHRYWCCSSCISA